MEYFVDEYLGELYNEFSTGNWEVKKWASTRMMK